ncbi:hypothetical protein GUJ93_ZPchr0008g11899 [Zizania palustris]|uniref:Uncharacterized protein n=1 Tax=Zizania palustris TaxID=103762 RepID=A0A8J5VH06_ZIZPA|nr:hypothetical protein GUJ93_ZPchr0008g11899 [Zizania palustris]
MFYFSRVRPWPSPSPKLRPVARPRSASSPAYGSPRRRPSSAPLVPEVCLAPHRLSSTHRRLSSSLPGLLPVVARARLNGELLDLKADWLMEKQLFDSLSLTSCEQRDE